MTDVILETYLASRRYGWALAAKCMDDFSASLYFNILAFMSNVA